MECKKTGNIRVEYDSVLRVICRKRLKGSRARFRHPDLVPKAKIMAKYLILNSALGGTRTPDTLVRSLMLEY